MKNNKEETLKKWGELLDKMGLSDTSTTKINIAEMMEGKASKLLIEDMNNERYNQIIDEVYGNYISYIHDIVQGEHQIYGNWYGKKEFINKCKTDPEFSEKWGLKIEKRELSLVERMEYYGKHFMKETESKTFDELLKVNYDELNTPTKLITVTYSNGKMEVYE